MEEIWRREPKEVKLDIVERQQEVYRMVKYIQR